MNRRNPLGEPVWALDSTWKKRKEALVTFPSGFSILELCAGAGTASLALKLLLGSDCLAGAWDTDNNLESIYKLIHGNHPGVHLGQTRGDILNTPLHAFPCANAVVCGPPCQPYSSYGQRGALDDPRAAPFQRCIDIVAELSSRRQSSQAPLMFAIFENTLGITQRLGGVGEPPLKEFLRKLRNRLGSEWSFSSVHVNSLDFGLPQSRNRVYVLGRRLEFYPKTLPAHPERFQFRVKAKQLLDLTDTRNAIEYTLLQEEGILAMKNKFMSSMRSTSCKGLFAFVEVGRDPTLRTLWRGASPKEDICECLRASGPQLHVFSLGEGIRDLSIDRGLRIHERAALQGFPSAIGQLPFTETAGRRIFGNAMSVPVVGSILAQELLAIEEFVGRATLERYMSPSVVAIAETQRYVPRTPPARHRYGWDSLRSCFRGDRTPPWVSQSQGGQGPRVPDSLPDDIQVAIAEAADQAPSTRPSTRTRSRSHPAIDATAERGPKRRRESDAAGSMSILEPQRTQDSLGSLNADCAQLCEEELPEGPWRPVRPLAPRCEELPEGPWRPVRPLAPRCEEVYEEELPEGPWRPVPPRATVRATVVQSSSAIQASSSQDHDMDSGEESPCIW